MEKIREKYFGQEEAKGKKLNLLKNIFLLIFTKRGLFQTI